MVRPRTTSDEEILAAAARAVGQVGAARLTLAAVAREAGLAPATLVQRFGSKRGLLLALAEHGSGTSPFEAARAANPSPLAALHEALGALASRVDSPEQMANNLGFLQLDLTDPEFREHAADDARRTGGHIAGLLAEAVAAGELRAGVDVPRLARAVQVAYNGSLILWSLTGDIPLGRALRADVDEVLDPHRPG
ncbi:TetR/AcrR family transcriptional regulator [Actinocorallia populi]|uniref:TetR/AcrR family transcriptional regulator n=1 Tax=Actinocorallia populi TaxID=2079200 RepID=UPI000D08C80F|nr:TetR/AcrR family transcriptional regulator [Actinocorallia populi]